ncbi:MAG: MFS transporter [Dehalococcoidia bacterium]
MEGWQRAFDSLSNPHFRMLFISMLVSFIGLHMGFMAQSALTYDLEGNATSLGIVVLAWGVPQMLFSLVGGVAADRINKRTIILFSQGTIGVLMLALAISIETGHVALWQIAGLGFVQGTVFSFNVPARQAWIPEIVGRDKLSNAIALNSSGFNMASVAGPFLAGGLITVPFIGFSGVYFIMAGCFFAVVLLLLRTPADGADAREDTGSSVIEDMKEGVHYVRAHSALMTMLAMGFVVIVLGMPYRTLFPVFAGEIYGVGKVGLGAMYTVGGIGAVVGSLLVAMWSQSPNKARLQLISGLGFAATLVVFALIGWFALALVTLAVMGLACMGFVALNNTMVLSASDPEYYGRVQSVYMLSWSVQPFAAMPVAVLADVWGAQYAVALTGVVVALGILTVRGYSTARRPAREALAAGDVT